MGWVGLATVMLKIFGHYLENKTPDAKKAYVKNLEEMSKSLAGDDVDSINDLFHKLRQDEGFGNGIDFGPELGRDIHRQ